MEHGEAVLITRHGKAVAALVPIADLETLGGETGLKVPFLFDTDAISEVLRPRPPGRPREDQYLSAVTVGKLFKGAYRSANTDRHLQHIEERVIPAVTLLPYDVATARVFGRVRAELEKARSARP